VADLLQVVSPWCPRPSESSSAVSPLHLAGLRQLIDLQLMHLSVPRGMSTPWATACRNVFTHVFFPGGQEGEKLDKEALMREAISGQMKERQDLERKLQTQVRPPDPQHCQPSNPFSAFTHHLRLWQPELQACGGITQAADA
jgi:hypothetical protein